MNSKHNSCPSKKISFARIFAVGVNLALLYSINSISLEFSALYWRHFSGGRLSPMMPIIIQSCVSVVTVILQSILMQSFRIDRILLISGVVALVAISFLPDESGAAWRGIIGFVGQGIFGAMSYLIVLSVLTRKGVADNIRNFSPILMFGAISIGALHLVIDLFRSEPLRLVDDYRKIVIGLGFFIVLLQLASGYLPACRRSENAPRASGGGITSDSFSRLLISGFTLYFVMVLSKMLSKHHLITMGVSTETALHILHWHRVAMFLGAVIPLLLVERVGWRRLALTGASIYAACFVFNSLFPQTILIIAASEIILGIGWSLLFVTVMAVGSEEHFYRAPVRFGVFAAIVFPGAGVVTLLYTPLYDAFGWLPLNIALLVSVPVMLLFIAPKYGTEVSERWTS